MLNMSDTRTTTRGTTSYPQQAAPTHFIPTLSTTTRSPAHQAIPTDQRYNMPPRDANNDTIITSLSVGVFGVECEKQCVRTYARTYRKNDGIHRACSCRCCCTTANNHQAKRRRERWYGGIVRVVKVIVYPRVWWWTHIPENATRYLCADKYSLIFGNNDTFKYVPPVISYLLWYKKSIRSISYTLLTEVFFV